MKLHPPSPAAGGLALCAWAIGRGLRRWGWLSAAAGAVLAKIAVDALKPWPMLFLVDQVLQSKPVPPRLAALTDLLPGGGAPADLLAASVGATVLLFLLSWALGLAYAHCSLTLGQYMAYDLASRLFAHLEHMSLRFHARKSVGDNIRRITADCACVSVILKDALLPAGAALVSLVVLLGILWQVNALLTLMALAVVPWMAWAFLRYARPMIEQGSAQQEAEAAIYQVAEQTLSSLPVIQAFSCEAWNQRRYAGATGRTLEATLSLTRVQFRFKLMMGLALASGTGLLLWYGTAEAMAGRLSVGALLLFLSYLTSFYEPLAGLMYTPAIIQGAGGSTRRVLEILAAQPEITNRPQAVRLERAAGAIRFEEVSFGYLPGRPVLRGLELEMKAGQRVALVGMTGAGKSTLASLIPRFFDPWEGRVTLDGHDLRDISLASLRQQIGIVLQEPFLFPVSVARNIAYGCPGASRAQVEEAAWAAGAHEFIARLPRGYRTVVGQGGATLSLGQRQRLTIARALLRNPPILILDEPTSALDAETEWTLLGMLELLGRDRTVVVIAHRLATVRQAHAIVVLDQGRVAEQGTHEHLLAMGGRYARLHALQTAGTTASTP